MKKQCVIAGLILALSGFAGTTAMAKPRSNVGMADQLRYEKQFKPQTLRSSRTIPSPAAVKEIGGISYGRHVDVKLKEGITVRSFPVGLCPDTDRIRSPRPAPPARHWVPLLGHRTTTA